ncbi:MAG: hypothetical protein HWN79_01505 [Candidatus Lokiarchaeota archaeon]|nr:hypothetical protein [Candidatus Lokiarchaeota archaeon]
MDEKFMISGVKRKSTAVESTYRFFQTIDLIISHLKRKADKEKIFELIRENPNLRSLLIATAAVHLYHYMGIKVQESLDSNQLTIDSTQQLHLREKQILMEEVTSLLKDSFELERGIFDEIIDLENMFLTLLIEERLGNLQETEKVKKIEDIEDQIEFGLLNIISKFPSFYFYDFIGDLIGLNDDVKLDILEEAAALKGVSLEVEKQLEQEEKEDKYIEVFTLNRLIERMQDLFEFKSYKELQVQTMPIRMIKKKILEYELNKYPISISGLNRYIEGNNLKRETIKYINNALEENLDYEQFEERILSDLKLEIIKQLKTNPNDFVYFLQSLYESSFEDVIFLLNKRGIKDTLHLINIDYELAEKVKKNMIRFNIKKQDLIVLNDNKKNLINIAKKALCNLKFPYLEKFMAKVGNHSEFDLFKILYRTEVEFDELWDILEKKTGFSINSLREFVRKKQIIDKIFFQDLNLSNYSQIILLINYDEIFTNLVTDLFYNILAKILRQLSRIIELYGIVSNDKAIFSPALRRADHTKDVEDWGQIKLEELSINRLMKRQQELVVVLNAINQVFLVNGFILSRLTNKSLKESIFELKNKESYVYKDIMPLKLKADLVSPISYCIAYDLIKRFENYGDTEKSKIISAKVEKQKKDADKKKESRKVKQENPFNWIERKITSTMMGISRPGMNPNQFYWEKKDTKIAIEQIKNHSGLTDDPFNNFCEFYFFAVEKIKSHIENMKLPSREEIVTEVSIVINEILAERLKPSPSPQEVKEMLDSERYKVAKIIALKIGSLLDKALYLKFKQKPKK